MSWFNDLSPVVQAALVAGTVAVLTALVTAVSTATNIALKARLDRRAAEAAARELQRDLYRKYADPLTRAAESLYWRLREILELGRSGYLGPGGGLTRFERYKVSSTIYRLAALLGWMTALHRELSLSNAQHDRSVGPMREALHEVESTLADGSHVERDKAIRLARLWNVRDFDAKAAGQDIDLVVDRYRHENRVASVADLEAQERSKLLVAVLEALVMRTDGLRVPPETLEATADEAIAVLSTREAWIYRDLQGAIGDWMLRRSGVGARGFDVMSYRGFVAAEREPTSEDTVWLGLLQGVVDEFDLGQDAQQDARIAQLRGVFGALANLIVRFHEAEPELSSVRATTLEAIQDSRVTAGTSS